MAAARLPTFAALCAFFFFNATAALSGIEYVFVSQPQLAQVVYFRVNALTHTQDPEPTRLVTKGLREPLGLAVDERRHRLYVADLRAKSVFMYNLVHEAGAVTTDGVQHVALKGVSPRWLSVDNDGTLFVTEDSGSITKVTAKEADGDGSQHKTLYASSAVEEVEDPSGIVADGKRLFWANRETRKHGGELVDALEVPDKVKQKRRHLSVGQAGEVAVLSEAKDQLYGVCASRAFIFYTSRTKSLLGSSKGQESLVESLKKRSVHQAGGHAKRPALTHVSDSLDAPRGCAWDGDGTIYVADKGANGIYSLPSTMRNLHLVHATKLFSIEKPYGVAVLPLPAQRVGFLQGTPGHGHHGGLIWGAGNPSQEQPSWDDGAQTTDEDGEAFDGGRARRGVCLWLAVPLLISLTCLAGAGFKGEPQLSKATVSCSMIISICVLMYMYHATDILYDILSGGNVEGPCMFIFVWAFIQIIVALVACGQIANQRKAYATMMQH